MRKILLAVILCLFMLSSCGFEEDAVILLGKQPIDPSNLTYINKYPVFKQRQRIYFILIAKEPIEDKKLRLQVLKLDMKYPYYAIEVAYGTDINRGSEKHYAKDYFVLHKPGNYVIRIFGSSDMEDPLAETRFMVEPL